MKQEENLHSICKDTIQNKQLIHNEPTKPLTSVSSGERDGVVECGATLE